MSTPKRASRFIASPRRQSTTPFATDRPGRINVELAVEDAQLRLKILDNGKGFSPDAKSYSGMGLHIMQFRANSIGGQSNRRVATRQGNANRMRGADEIVVGERDESWPGAVQQVCLS